MVRFDGLRGSPRNGRTCDRCRRHGFRDSGTRCSRFAFMRPAEIVHTPASRSISVHCAKRSSPERAAATSPWATPACAAPRPAGVRASLRCGRPGLSVRNSIATAHCITALMRWRARRAVPGFECRMGVRTSSRSVLVASETGRSPSRGTTSRPRLADQSLGWFIPAGISFGDHTVHLF